MYRVAVCDDSRAQSDHTCGLCSKILADSGLPFHVSAFSEPLKLLEALRAEPSAFNLLLLDIEMDGMTGLELARALRADGNRVSIIFTTGHEEYLRDGYDVQPIHYLIKPLTADALKRAIQTDLQLNHLPKTVRLDYGNRHFFLELDQIIYIESQNHNLYVWMRDEVRSFRIPLSRVVEALPADRFCRCHNSFIVNMAWIEEILRLNVRLKNQKLIPVGRSYLGKLQSEFVSYLNNT